MNPYDFVPLDLERPPERRQADWHEQYLEGTLTGTLAGMLTAETPLFLPDKRRPREFLRTNARPTLPASGLKGLFRSVVETVAPGCFWLFDGSYERGAVQYAQKLPQAYRRCAGPHALCAACRLFGMLDNTRVRPTQLATPVQGRGGTVMGKVAFSDAVCALEDERAWNGGAELALPRPDGPKPRHEAWYLTADGSQVAGRKFYFHHQPKEIRSVAQPNINNPRTLPLDAGSRFSFRASFHNVAADEWPALLYALVLEDGMRHKTGYGKPAGLGSIRVELTRLTLVNPRARYTGEGEAEGDYQGEALTAYLLEQTRPYRERRTPTIVKLREIWQWPPHARGYSYPGQSWFKEHPTTPISASP